MAYRHVLIMASGCTHALCGSVGAKLRFDDNQGAFFADPTTELHNTKKLLLGAVASSTHSFEKVKILPALNFHTMIFLNRQNCLVGGV